MSCCSWKAFREDFPDYYANAKVFDVPPTAEAWADARRDWMAGSTPWEAAQIALGRVKDRAEKAARKPLVHLGGRNYAEAGSALLRSSPADRLEQMNARPTESDACAPTATRSSRKSQQPSSALPPDSPSPDA